MSVASLHPPAGGTFVWDDRLWQEVWDRHLSPVERHALALDLLRGRWPDDVFERSVIAELARQWRRTAGGLVVVWSSWVLFWGVIAVTAPPGTDPWALPWAMAVTGLVVVVAVVAFRRRLGRHARGAPPAV